jgi:predicted CXXCH cytochrome family protein
MSTHPKVAKDPLHPETNEWNCISCHNPHQSKSEHLFRYDYERKVTPYQGVSCYVCHDEDSWKRPKLEVPAWNGYGEAL